MKKFIPAMMVALLSAQRLWAQEEAPAREGGFTQTLIMLGIALVFFYFILWRPEQKRRKAQEAKRTSLKKGDRVSAVGIIGTVFKVQNDTVILKMVDGSKIEVMKMAISDILPAAAPSPEDKEIVEDDKKA